jgi:hypothetical protein
LWEVLCEKCYIELVEVRAKKWDAYCAKCVPKRLEFVIDVLCENRAKKKDDYLAKNATLSLSKCVLQKKQQLFLLFFSGCLGFFVKKHKILFGSIFFDEIFHT